MNSDDENSGADELVAAYLDGTLTGEPLKAFQARLANEPSLVALIARWRANDDLLRDAFAAPMSETFSEDRLQALGLGMAETSPAPVTDIAVARAQRDETRSRWRGWRVPAMGAIAASLVAVIVATSQTGSGGGLEGDRAFQIAMQSTPSRSTAALDDGGSVSPLLTFAAGDGRFCREFATRGSSGASQNGIACLNGEKWSVEALAATAPDLSDPREIRTAEGADGSALDDTYARLDAGDAFDAAREAQLIAQGWPR